MPVGHTCDHRTKLDAVGMPGSESQRTICFEHLIFGRSNIGYLEKVIHYPQTIETGAFCPLCDQPEGITKLRLPSGPRKIGDL